MVSAMKTKDVDARIVMDRSHLLVEKEVFVDLMVYVLAQWEPNCVLGDLVEQLAKSLLTNPAMKICATATQNATMALAYALNKHPYATMDTARKNALQRDLDVILAKSCAKMVDAETHVKMTQFLANCSLALVIALASKDYVYACQVF
jgi:hypothetical protein